VCGFTLILQKITIGKRFSRFLMWKYDRRYENASLTLVYAPSEIIKFGEEPRN